MSILLAIDLGGTKCAIGLFELNSNDFEPLAQAVYSSGSFTNIDEIIRVFLGKTDRKPDFACLGVAGVVRGGKARMTNLPWKMDETALAEKFSLKSVRLINDLTAFCSAIPVVGSEALLVLQEGVPERGEMIGVIAPGTGLGEGYLLENDVLFCPRGSEGGHANFSPVTEEQIELLRWLQKNNRVVSTEMVCAGPAISTLYDFLKAQGGKESDRMKRELEQVADRTPVIVQNALTNPPCHLCVKTMELFLSLLGTEAGNLALKLYSTQGLFIGGGIIPRLVGKFPFTSFLHAFRQMGEMRELIERIPVKVVLKRETVLHGAVRYGRKIFLA